MSGQFYDCKQGGCHYGIDYVSIILTNIEDGHPAVGSNLGEGSPGLCFNNLELVYIRSNLSERKAPFSCAGV